MRRTRTEPRYSLAPIVAIGFLALLCFYIALASSTILAVSPIDIPSACDRRLSELDNAPQSQIVELLNKADADGCLPWR